MRRAIKLSRPVASRSVRTKEKGQFVYFLLDATRERIKIGQCSRLSRFNKIAFDLKRKYPIVKARCLKIIIGDLALESELHQRFANLKIWREWFRAAPELVEFIDSVDGFVTGWKFDFDASLCRTIPNLGPAGGSFIEPYERTREERLRDWERLVRR